MRDEATFRVKAGLAEMLKGGVIMDVVDAEQAKIAEDAGAAAVMALERVPADIRRDGGVARMSDPAMIKGIQEAVTIPVMAKARIGHFAEAQVLEALEVDYIDESEVLTPADEAHHIDKWAFRIPFVCGATNLGEALRRIGEGAAMIRSKGEAGTGDIVEAVRHLRSITGEIKRLGTLDEIELFDGGQGAAGAATTSCAASPQNGKLPVPLFCAGGIATPADASLVMQLGAEAVFVGSGIFKSEDPAARCRARSSRRRRTSPTPSASRAASRGPRARRWTRSRRASSTRRKLLAEPRLVGRTAWRRSSASWRSRAASTRTCSVLRALGAEVREVRVPADLDGLDGLVLPGGESTTMTLGDRARGPGRAAARPRRAPACPVLGTCAGLIMLDRDHLGLMDIVAERNAFGRQIRSFEDDLDFPDFDGGPVHAVFIRAPWIAEHGAGVEILAAVDGHPVAAREGAITVVAFHPELSGEHRLHAQFLERVRARVASRSRARLVARSTTGRGASCSR